MSEEEFAASLEAVRMKLYKTALPYLGSESMALDAVNDDWLFEVKVKERMADCMR